MDEVRELSAVNAQARIRQLERKRDERWSTAGGSTFAANIYRAFLDGRRVPSEAAVVMAAAEGYDLMERYRYLLAEKVAASAIAKAQARCIADELHNLRACGKQIPVRRQID